MKNHEKVIKSRPTWRKKTQVQRLHFVMAVVAAALCAVVAVGAFLTWAEVAQPFSPPVSRSLPSATPVSSEEGLPVYENDYCLLLVNSNRALPEDYETGLKLKDVGGVQVDERIAPALAAFLDAAEKGGVELTLSTGYVSGEEQARLFREESDRLVSEGYSRARAEDKVQIGMGKSGYNENQTGMAVEFAAPGDFAGSAQYRWLLDHCVEYGFILRYPEDKTSATGRTFSPAHFRYVGVKNALKMRQLSMCLEEYSAYVAKQS